MLVIIHSVGNLHVILGSDDLMAMVISMPIDQHFRCEVDLHRCEQDDYDTAAYQQAKDKKVKKDKKGKKERKREPEQPVELPHAKRKRVDHRPSHRDR